MKALGMRAWIAKRLSGRLQVVLISSFSLIAALTVGLNAIAISRVIEDYLQEAQDRRVARDMDLAEAFYQLKLDKVDDLANRVARDPVIRSNLDRMRRGTALAHEDLEETTLWHTDVSNMVGTYWILILDQDGRIVSGGSFNNLEQRNVVDGGDWGALPIVSAVRTMAKSQMGTEVIPAERLAEVSLDQQARLVIKDTPRAAPQPYDLREGEAGLALVSVQPIGDAQSDVSGFVVAGHLFNNDFTLVDRIREVAGVDTVTIFFGDLRVSTNVPDEYGERAVGTRISQEVREVVLDGGQPFKGEAFVVKEAFITRYEPLRDHAGQVVGSLYVGARLSAFQQLVNDLISQVAIIALVGIMLAAVLAVPIARLIIRPIGALVDATKRLAHGDMSVKVAVDGSGELAVLSQSFNSMVATLRKTQKELLHKEKLASMGQLAAGVAHEINNPLGTILLLASVLKSDARKGELQREDLERIVNEANRCKRIVSDLLNFSRQQEVLAQPTNLTILLDEVLESFSRQEMLREIRVERCYADLPSMQADPEQLKQVFINLLNNAIEAMDGRGVIRIETNMADTQWLEIKLTDEGCGIPEEHLGKLFTPFFTTKSLGKGTGLGLSIVYGIIKMHRGQISVQSRVGEGTTFIITLPVRPFQTALSADDVESVTPAQGFSGG